MATSEELLSKMNESVGVLQSAQQTVVQGAELIGNTKTLATEAKTAADSAKTIANEAKTVADSAKTLATQASNNAGNALQKSGGTMTGTITNLAASIDITQDPESRRDCISHMVKDKNNVLIANDDLVHETNGTLRWTKVVRRIVDGVEKWCNFGLYLEKNGAGYGTINTPPVNAIDSAIQNKASVSRDFLAKTGGSLNGHLIMGRPAPSGDAYKLMWQDSSGARELDIFPSFNSDANTLLACIRAQRTVGGSGKSARFQLGIDGEGRSYTDVTLPTEGRYDSQVDTVYSSTNRHPLLIPDYTFYMYLGGSNASDTLDLFKGRGLSAAMPFATLEALARFLEYHYVAANKPIVIQLQTNITSGSVDFHACNIENLVIQGATAATKLTLTGPLNILSGNVRLQQITLQSSGSLSTFAKVGSGYTNAAKLTLGNCAMNGAVTDGTVWVCHDGVVDVVGDVTGTVTGKRYLLQSCGKLLTGGRGASAIPGNQEGSVSGSAVVS